MDLTTNYAYGTEPDLQSQDLSYFPPFYSHADYATAPVSAPVITSPGHHYAVPENEPVPAPAPLESSDPTQYHFQYSDPQAVIRSLEAKLQTADHTIAHSQWEISHYTELAQRNQEKADVLFNNIKLLQGLIYESHYRKIGGENHLWRRQKAALSLTEEELKVKRLTPRYFYDDRPTPPYIEYLLEYNPKPDKATKHEWARTHGLSFQDVNYAVHKFHKRRRSQRDRDRKRREREQDLANEANEAGTSQAGAEALLADTPKKKFAF